MLKLSDNAQKTAARFLPLQPVASIRKPDRLKYFIIAEPKWGKTTFFSGIDNCLLLAFEEGHAFISARKIVIDKWDCPLTVRRAGGSWCTDDDGITHSSAVEVVDALEIECPYGFIIIDTADMASKMCTDYMCANNVPPVKHPSDGGDFGKGWDLLQTTPFRQWFGRLVKLGCGIACISHIDVKEVEDKKTKVKTTKRESTLPKGIQKFIHTQADVIINGSFGRRRKGEAERDRIVSFDGSNDVLAGSRVRGVVLPKKYIVAPPTDTDQSVPWRQWSRFFDPANGPDLARQAEALYESHGILGADDEHVPTAPTQTDEAGKETEADAAKAAAKAESEGGGGE